MFDSSDDVIYQLVASYDGQTRVNMAIANGPLSPGSYRFSILPSITDVVGNPLDGNGDGTGGDPFVRTFTILPPPDGETRETSGNASFGTSTWLEMREDPAGSALFIGRGHGSLDPADDHDYWSFEGRAGDLVSVMTQSASPGYQGWIAIYNAAGNQIAYDDGRGPDYQDYISRFELPADGVYYVEVGARAYYNVLEDYVVHLFQTRGMNHELDPDYANNTIAKANPISYQVSGDRRDAVAAGVVMAGQSGTVDVDVFDLGQISSGESILISSRFPSSGTLRPLIEIRDANNFVVNQGGNPSDSVARADVSTAGRYYAVFAASQGNGPRGNYLLDIAVQPTSNLNFADLAIATVSAPKEASSGQTVEFEWVVGNFGAAATSIDAWTDRVVLSKNDRYGDGDDIQLMVRGRTGRLNLGASYTAKATAQLPLGLSGTYYVLIKADADNQVPEFIFEENNIRAAADPLVVKLTDYADLALSDVTVSKPIAFAGEPLSVGWKVTNSGPGVTGNGIPGGTVNQWTDRLILSTDRFFGNADDIVLADVTRDGSLAPGGSYLGNWTGLLPTGLSNRYRLFVMTDFGTGFGKVYEYTDAQSNLGQSSEFSIAREPFADLTASWNVTPAIGEIGKRIDVAWTVTNDRNTALAKTTESSWRDVFYLSRDMVAGNSDDVWVGEVTRNGTLELGATYTDAASLTLPLSFTGDGYLYVKTDATDRVYEFLYEGNNTSSLRPIRVQAPDLVAEVTLRGASAFFGESLRADYRVTNQGTAAASGPLRDRFWISRDRVLDWRDVEIGAFDAVTNPLSAGQSYQRTDVTLALPLSTSVGAGAYYLIVSADGTGVQSEISEANNVAVSASTIQLSLPPLPDLVIEDLKVVEATPTAGQSVTLRWKVANRGRSAVTNAFTERAHVINTGTGAWLADRVSPVPLGASGLIPAGATIDRELTIKLPDGVAGGGNFQVTITADWNFQVVEGIEGSLAESNNVTTLTFRSVLPPYPDLIVQGATAAPKTVKTGESTTFNWTVFNSGTASVTRDFDQRVRVMKAGTSTPLAEFVKRYSVATDGAIGAGQGVAQSASIKIPDGSGSVGELELIVTIDSADEVFEYNADGKGELNNSGSTNVTATLAAYPDLAVSNVTAPERLIADPARISVSWRVENVSTGDASAMSWTDAVVLSTNDIYGDSDDRRLGVFSRPRGLASGQSYQRTESFVLPPALTGRFHLFVKADSQGVIFEDDRLANNAASPSNFVDVMPIAYADLLPTRVDVPAASSSGSEIEVAWRVENRGIGLTDRAVWTDSVSLATDPEGKNRIRTLGYFQHFGQLEVGAGYDRTATVTLPEGISGRYYLVLETGGGVFEFIYTGNNDKVSGGIDVSLTSPPDLVVSDIQAPSLPVEEGTLIDIGWTVTNSGTGLASGAWEDTVHLRKVGDPSAPIISLGSYRYEGLVEPGKSYTRREQVRLPVRVYGVYETVVTTNEGGRLYEHEATNNNTRVDDAPVTITVRPRPDLQVLDLIAPDKVDPGQTVAVDFTILNQGTVATTVPRWTDRVYLSLDPIISGDDILIAETGNQSALEPGEQYRTITQSAVVPLRFRGTVYLIVQTDATGVMEEWPNEANNTFYRELYVVPQPLPDLVTSGVVAPTQAIEGATIEVRFTVTNLGPGTTPVNNWSDTVWLTRDKNRPHPGQGDFLLKTLNHSGALVNKAGYDVVTTVTLPTGLASGIYYITPWTDPYDVVLEDTLADNVNPDDPREIDNNNYKARAIDVIGLSRPLPDLTVSDLVVAPTGTGGENYAVRYSVTNEGKGNASGSWVDRVWLVPSPDTPLNDANAMLLAEVQRSGVDAKSTYQESLDIKLSPSAMGSHIVVVTDFVGNRTSPTISGSRQASSRRDLPTSRSSASKCQTTRSRGNWRRSVTRSKT
jgi:subtilase family serine protease